MGREPKAPNFDKFMNPILQGLSIIGGSATLREIRDKVIEIMSLPEEMLVISHRAGQTEVEYRIAWALTYLKKAGLINNSSRGVWSLVIPYSERINEKELIKKVRTKDIVSPVATVQENEIAEEEDWKTETISVIQSLAPDAFERLCQRLLRESGFIEVVVTGRSGDGGIDGRGILQLAGLVGFRVMFQSKRYKGTVGPSEVREFQGAIIGRADRGIFITTGSFTKDARREATRDGAPIIDLVDGELLIEKMKEYKMGLDTEMVEKVILNKEWFYNI